MTEVCINPKQYKQHAELFEQIPDGVGIVIEWQDHDDYYVDRLEGETPEARKWIEFIENWIGADWNEIIDRHAFQAIGYALADWTADRDDYLYETSRDRYIDYFVDRI